MAFTELTEILISLGFESLGQFWAPVLLWTGLAGIILYLQRFLPETVHDNRYYLRAALLLSLPSGLAVNGLLPMIGRLSASASSVNAQIILIEMPAAMKTAAAGGSTGVQWSSPALWLGLVTAVAMTGIVIMLIRLFKEWTELYMIYREVEEFPMGDLSISYANRSLLYGLNVEVRFGTSQNIAVPLTFGIMKPTILLPDTLKKDPQKLNMAVRHELIHIRRKDYLLNIFLLVVKALFWFHPLVYKLYGELKQYREISCDSAVLADRSIDRKQYAELLYEFSPRADLKHGSLIGISDSTSILKKRIKTMKQHPLPSRPNWKNTITVLLIIAGLSGMMACTDLQNQSPDITEQPEGKVDIKGVGTLDLNMDSTPPDDIPLYIVDGKTIKPEEGKSVLSQINPKNIKSIEVLKDSAATSVYGTQAANGVVIITTKETESPPPPPKPEKPEKRIDLDVDLDLQTPDQPEKDGPPPVPVPVPDKNSH